MNFGHYFKNQDVDSLLQAWAGQYPRLVHLATIGQSYEKRPIWLLTLTNQDTGSDLEKPAVWIDANIHATEIAGTTTALLVAESLLSGYGTDPRLTRLLDTCVYYIVPRVNPDGAELALSDRPRYIRSGVRHYPWLEKEDGLHSEDIDGDGRILQMRVPDPNGDWKISSLDPRLLEKRQPDEQGGAYYRLFSEGLIEDYDGYVVKLARTPEGLDFNRNFPYDWRPENEQHGAGPYPASEPEIKALADFTSSHRNINFAITFHTFSRVLLRPYSTKSDDEMEFEDLLTYKKIGEIGTKASGYRCVSTYHDFRSHPKEVTTGAFDDWVYDHLGAFTFTIELWDLPTAAGIKDRKFNDWFLNHPHEEDLQILKWAEQNSGAEVYVDWHPYQHPQLGAVEIGGWDMMFTWRNPPVSQIENEAKLHVPFMLSLGDMLPHLALHTFEVTPLGGDDYQVNLVVENTGFLPTYTSQQGKKRKAVRPVRAEIDLPAGATLVSGKRREELGHLEGRSSHQDVTQLWGEAPTDHRARQVWVVHAPQGGEIAVHVRSERAGSLGLKASLEKE